MYILIFQFAFAFFLVWGNNGLFSETSKNIVGTGMTTPGLWNSPITLEKVVKDSIALQELHCDEGHICWTEMRPFEQGRSALVKLGKEEKAQNLLPTVSVRSRVYEYGGGAFSIKNGTIYFCHDKERSLCKISPTEEVTTLLKEDKRQYADFAVSSDEKLLFCVGEDHTDPKNVTNYLVGLNLQTKKSSIVAEGHDFYSSPCISPDKKLIAFITWDHPNMPWDGSDLWVAEILPDDSLKEPRHIAGGKSESVGQPLWSPEGVLYFTSDRSGFWNLYSYKEGLVESLYEMEADFAMPAWVMGRYSYAYVSYQGKPALVCSYTEKGIDRLGILHLQEKKFEFLDVPFTVMSHLCAQDAENVFFLGGSPLQPRSVVRLNIKTKKYDLLKQSFVLDIDEDYVSIPEMISFPSSPSGEESYAFYYPPKNPTQKNFSPEQTPIIVKCHGGPTGHTPVLLNLETQFWTTRGFGVLDVNYGGSTGYGRKYRQRLNRNWGVVDVADCTNAALYLVQKGLADPKHLFIKGGSAGGFTVLCALASSSVFAGGTSYYGVADLELLVQDTHKFEKYDLDKLIAPYPQEKQVYKERSPLYRVGHIQSAVLLLQGKEDLVVPPNQSENMYKSLKEKNIPAELILFDGEQHGFRKADTILKSLEAEWDFYLGLLKS